jgi:hypothetical protein
MVPVLDGDALFLKSRIRYEVSILKLAPTSEG